MFETVAFYTFAFLTLSMFSIAVLTKQSLYALTATLAGMLFIAGLFWTLDAEFLGAIQIVVYGGAVLVLYGFGMMFFDTTRDLKENNFNAKVIIGLSGLAALLVVALFVAPIVSDNIHAYYPAHENIGNSQELGYILFTKYLVPFEVAAVMLLVAMIAGIVLAGKKMDQSLTLMKEEEVLTLDNCKEEGKA